MELPQMPDGLVEYLEQQAGCALPDQCFLCGSSPYMIGLFVPENAREWGAPSGKTRIFIYCLCKKCFDLPDALTRIEKIVYPGVTQNGFGHA